MDGTRADAGVPLGTLDARCGLNVSSLGGLTRCQSSEWVPSYVVSVIATAIRPHVACACATLSLVMRKTLAASIYFVLN
eukprot:3493777-Pyramimonas_sp.AAC.1